MKILKRLLVIVMLFFMAVNFSNCASSKRIEKSAPLTVGDAYYQNSISGVKGGESGFNIFIPITSNPNNIILDSIYFKNKAVKLEYKSNNLFVGRFKTSDNQKEDIVMSNEPYAEYGNKLPQFSKPSPFNLEDHECIISYSYKENIKYFKIENVVRKESTDDQ